MLNIIFKGYLTTMKLMLI